MSIITIHPGHYPDTTRGTPVAPPSLTRNEFESPETGERPEGAIDDVRSDSPGDLSASEGVELNSAHFMALESPPCSEAARRLTDRITAVVLAQDKLAGRKYERGAPRQSLLSDAVGRTLGDLLIGRDVEAGWSYRSQSRSSFTGSSVSYRDFRVVRDALVAAGLIQTVRGFSDRSGGVNWGGKAGRMRPREPLLAMARAEGILQGQAREHFHVLPPKRPLELRSCSRREGRRKAEGRSMRILRTPQTEQLEAEVRELNEFTTSVKFEGGVHQGYRRIFNCGDAATFNWNKGGRLFGVGEESYQRLKKELRWAMRINDEPVVEIDVQASHLTMLYALQGEHLDTSHDPYNIEGLPRAVVKAWVTMTLGYDRFHARWSPEVKKELEEHGLSLKGLSAPVVRERILATHPILKDWPEGRLSCFDLMFLESEAILGTMLTLKRAYSVVCLSVHDSIIVPASAQSVAEEVIKTEYAKAIGVTPSLKLNTPRTAS